MYVCMYIVLGTHIILLNVVVNEVRKRYSKKEKLLGVGSRYVCMAAYVHLQT